MQRVTEKQLEAVVERINTMTGSPLTGYTKIGAGYRANIGNYHLYHAYGSVGLHRIQTDGGGVTQVIGLGTKRELLNQMWAFIAGFEASK